MDNYTKTIVKIFAANPFDSFNHKQIASRMEAHDKASRQKILSTILELAENKILVEDDHKGKYKINPKSINDEILPQNFVTGTIDMKKGGKAYLIPSDTDREDILIAPGNTHHALDGDTVKVLMFPQRKMHKPEGQVVAILQRARTRFVGTIQRNDRFAFMVSDNRNMQVDIFIPLSDLLDAQNGDKVVVEMTDWPDQMNNPVGKVVKRLGRPGDNNVEMLSILAEYDFPLDFPDAVRHEAESLTDIKPSDYESRRDFRNVTTFTIDPADAKDFDDALSFNLLPDGNIQVGIHIADVSHFVAPGSAIDQEAYLRGTSIYLVDRTIPMLPERLCNDLCSLRPHEDRLTFSVVVDLTPDAKVTNVWFGKGVINSDERFAYEEAQAIIDAHKIEGEETPTATPNPISRVRLDDSLPATHQGILRLHNLAAALRTERYKLGAINFESQEVKFQLDENAKPIGVYIKEQKEANWLVEEFMLLANKKVAEHIGCNRRNPKTFVYRVHDEPNPEKLNTFVAFVAKLGFKIKTTSRKALAASYNQLFVQSRGRGEEYLIDNIAVRTMAKAVYSTNNIGHYGLAFPFYTHFTSPIRRYPDLMVHRLLQHYLLGGASADQQSLEERCKHCSAMEKVANDAERESVKYKQAEFLHDKLGQTFPAVISGVSKWGLYAEIQGNKCEGMIPVASITGDYFMLDEDNYQLIGRRYGKTYKLGDPVNVKVSNVDMSKKQIDLILLPDEDETLTYRTNTIPYEPTKGRSDSHSTARKGSSRKSNSRPSGKKSSKKKR